MYMSCRHSTHRGPSPHTRGSHQIALESQDVLWSIPAYAGKPGERGSIRGRRGVHPRIRGEAFPFRFPFRFRLGPSPHTRGSPRRTSRRSSSWRSIPAYAGKPPTETPSRCADWVHPRIRGEAPHRPRRVVPPIGSIPAYAGKPVAEASLPHDVRVHPRIRGEAVVVLAVEAGVVGPSPHTRGSLLQHTPRGNIGGSIPAYAGKPLHRGHTAMNRSGPSPHTRGSRLSGTGLDGRRRSIPAYAGKPSAAGRAQLVRGVHPRIRGEAGVTAFRLIRAVGPSPHTRGSPMTCAHCSPCPGSIPAYAGKPRY